MMLGDRSYIHDPPWPYPPADDFTTPFNADDYSAFFHSDSLPQLFPIDDDIADFVPSDAHTCDNFRMFDFKVRKCTRTRSHDWTDCPYAHPGEKARRRDPRRYHYSGTSCPDFRKGCCRKGDACEFAHGVFECWLHPARYRTQPCKDGMACRRRVCFFAHSPDQLRVLSPRADSFDGGGSCGSPRRLPFLTSPEMPESPLTESPPMSPNAVNEIVASLRRLHLNKVKSMPSPSWMGGGGQSSPRVNSVDVNLIRPGFFSLPTTPTRAVIRPEIGYVEVEVQEAEGGVEWVESGRDLRAKMFEKLSKENPLDHPNPNPDVDWVSELVN